MCLHRCQLLGGISDSQSWAKQSEIKYQNQKKLRRTQSKNRVLREAAEPRGVGGSSVEAPADGAGMLSPRARGPSVPTGIPPPSLLGPPQKSPEAPGSPPLLSEPGVHSTCVRASFVCLVFFISECCAQDCESEKSPRSQHQCKHTRVYLQARTCVQVYPTERSRDLDPEVAFSLVLSVGLRDLQKGWSNSSNSVYILIWGIQAH